MAMNEKQLARWAKVRQGGRTRYIWLYGVLMWGVFTAVGFTVAMAIMNGTDDLWTMLPLSLVIFPIGGYFFGVWTWKIAEKQFAAARRAPSPGR